MSFSASHLCLSKHCSYDSTYSIFSSSVKLRRGLRTACCLCLLSLYALRFDFDFAFFFALRLPSSVCAWKQWLFSPSLLLKVSKHLGHGTLGEGKPTTAKDGRYLSKDKPIKKQRCLGAHPSSEELSLVHDLQAWKRKTIGVSPKQVFFNTTTDFCSKKIFSLPVTPPHGPLNRTGQFRGTKL